MTTTGQPPRRGLGFQDLAALQTGPGPALDPAQDLVGAWPEPVTIAWAMPDPATVLGVARAIHAYRRRPPVIIDAADQLVARFAKQRQVVSTPQLAQAAEQLRGSDDALTPDPGLSIVGHDGSAPELIAAVALLRRSYEAVLVAGWDDTVAGIADRIVVPMAWTDTATRNGARLLDRWHRDGEPVTGRVVIAAHADPADPGVETRARRWFTQLRICPIPADPATRSPGRSWDELQPTTQTAYARLAGTLARKDTP